MTTKMNPEGIKSAAAYAAATHRDLQAQSADASHVEFLSLLPLIERAAKLQQDIEALAAALAADNAEGV